MPKQQYCLIEAFSDPLVPVVPKETCVPQQTLCYINEETNAHLSAIVGDIYSGDANPDAFPGGIRGPTLLPGNYSPRWPNTVQDKSGGGLINLHGGQSYPLMIPPLYYNDDQLDCKGTPVPKHTAMCSTRVTTPIPTTPMPTTPAPTTPLPTTPLPTTPLPTTPLPTVPDTGIWVQTLCCGSNKNSLLNAEDTEDCKKKTSYGKLDSDSNYKEQYQKSSASTEEIRSTSSGFCICPKRGPDGIKWRNEEGEETKGRRLGFGYDTTAYPKGLHGYIRNPVGCEHPEFKCTDYCKPTGNPAWWRPSMSAKDKGDDPGPT